MPEECGVLPKGSGRLNVIVPYATDFHLVSPGGIASYLRLYLAHRDPAHRVQVWGATPAGADTAPAWCAPGVTYRSILSVRNSRLPLNLRFMQALAKQVLQRQIPSDAVLYVQRTEHLVPLIALGYRGPVVLTIHGSSRFSVQAMPPVKARLYNAMERRVIHRARRVTLVSRDGLEYYKEIYPDLAERFVHIPNPVNTDEFVPGGGQAFRKQVGVGEHDLVLLYHGRMEPEKGVRLLVPVLAAVLRQRPDAHLVLVGSGSEQEAVAELARQYGVAHRTHLVPHMPREEMSGVVAAADVSLLTSAFEGMPMSVLESLACGVPVVAFPVGDVPVLVEDKVTGMLVHTRDSLAVAQAVCDVVKSDVPYARQCRERALCYAAPRLIPRVDAVLAEAVGGHR